MTRRKRPCRICRRWFDPHPRVGDRQRVCSKPECQRERHRRWCEDSRRKSPDAGREERLRGLLRGEAGGGRAGSGPGRETEPTREAGPETETETEPETRSRDSPAAEGPRRPSTVAAIEGARAALGELRLGGLRDVVPPKLYVILDEFLRLLGRLGRDVVAAQHMKIQGEFGRHRGWDRRDEMAGGRGPP